MTITIPAITGSEKRVFSSAAGAAVVAVETSAAVVAVVFTVVFTVVGTVVVGAVVTALTVMNDDFVTELLPTSLVAVSVMEYDPGFEYVWDGFCEVELYPSPKAQYHVSGL